MSDFQLRPATEADHPFIYSATAKSLRSSPLYTDLHQDHYREIINGYVARMLTSPWHQTVAHPNGYPTEIAGFVLHTTSPGNSHNPSKPVVGFIYVAEPYRRQHVATDLLRHATNGRHDFLAVLAQPKVLNMCRDNGLKPQLSPYLL